MLPDDLAATRISTALRHLRLSVGTHGVGESGLGDLVARVVTRGDGFHWTVSGPGGSSDVLASGDSVGLEAACASAAIQLVDAADRTLTISP